jgi:hypothetical protein
MYQSILCISQVHLYYNALYLNSQEFFNIFYYKKYTKIYILFCTLLIMSYNDNYYYFSKNICALLIMIIITIFQKITAGAEAYEANKLLY